MTWTLAEAIELCKLVEQVCVVQGDCHVALTGGLLYGEGPRKDCDLVFYRVRQVDKIDVECLFAALATVGVELADKDAGERFVVKAKWRGKPIDCLFPEVPSGDYVDDSKVAHAAAVEMAAAMAADNDEGTVH